VTVEPVAVIGAGPVGLTAALLLARWGLPVAVLERRATRDTTGSRSICQQRDVLDVWASVGAGAIAEEGLTWTTARTFYRDHELSRWSFAARGASPLPPFVNISQARTEEILGALAGVCDRVDVRWAHEVGGLSQDATGVTLHCANGAVVRASHVICCAGARAGALRDALGVRFDGRAFAEEFLICDIRAALPGWEAERRFYFDPAWNPGRQVLIHPCPDSTFRIDWQVPPGFDLAAEEAEGGLDRRIRQIVGTVPYELVWRSVYRFHSRIADRMRVGRVLLAGDCAHLVAPFGARGLNSGVPDAENAAWKVAFVVRGWAPEDLLASYQDERHAAAEENLAVTDATMNFLVPRSAAGRRVRRETLERALRDPASSAAVDSGRLAEPYWYAGSPLTTPEPSRPFAGRPPKGEDATPAPGVIVPDVPVSVPGAGRLREVVRGGFTVLLAGRTDGAALGHAARAATRAPVTVLDLDPAAAGLLGAEPGDAWLIRPDAHIAAMLPGATPERLATAVRRALGYGLSGRVVPRGPRRAAR
jgi:pentachlorophenol monooxygenase/3-(3-hydroxy-phenyl)propionate hydroxylase